MIDMNERIDPNLPGPEWQLQFDAMHKRHHQEILRVVAIAYLDALEAESLGTITPEQAAILRKRPLLGETSNLF